MDDSERNDSNVADSLAVHSVVEPGSLSQNLTDVFLFCKNFQVRFDSKVANSLMESRNWDGLKSYLMHFDPERKSLVLMSVTNALNHIKDKNFVSALSVLKRVTTSELLQKNLELFDHFKSLETNLETGPFIFNEDLAIGYITNKNWHDLHTYLSRFLMSNPIDGTSSHPGFWLSFLELIMLDVLENDSIVAAEGIINDFTNKLPETINNDPKLWPTNMHSRIQSVKSNIKKGEFEPDYKKKTQDALLDYMRLYFRDQYWPEIKDDLPWDQFVRKEADKTYCLACGYWPKDARGEKFIPFHLCPEVGLKMRRKCCDGMTMYLANKARKVFLNGGELTYAEYESLYKLKGKWRIIPSEGTSISSRRSAYEKAPKKARLEVPPGSSTVKSVESEESDTEDSSGSSPDKARESEAIDKKAISVELKKIVGELLSMNMDVRSASNDIEELCNEQSAAIYKLSFVNLKFLDPLVFLDHVSALDVVNLKFVSVKDQSPEFKSKLLQIIEKSYDLRKLCMSSVKKVCCQSNGFVICKLVSKLMEANLQITRLIQKNPEKVDESLKEHCKALNAEAGKIMALFHEHKLSVSTLSEHISILVTVKKNLVPFLKSLPELCSHILNLDDIFHKMGKLFLNDTLDGLLH